MSYTVYALAGQEHCCRVQFRLVQARSLIVAFYAPADEELDCRLTRSFGTICSFSSCRQGALVPCAV